jgi:hypothetical protein
MGKLTSTQERGNYVDGGEANKAPISPALDSDNTPFDDGLFVCSRTGNLSRRGILDQVIHMSAQAE